MTETSALIIVTLAAFSWMVVLLLPWRPWFNTEALEPSKIADGFDLSELTVVIPARNEADVITETLQGLAAQGTGLRVLVVDDNSTDATAETVRTTGGISAELISGQPLPDGWSGKLWALDQGVRRVDTRYILLLDADILLKPGMLTGMVKKMRAHQLHFLSIMATLRMHTLWEKLLMPAFIYFFKLMYPFRLANSPSRHFSAAAGGCILLETRLLKEIDGFTSLRDRLIDDCSLAHKIKQAGYRTWIGQSHSVISLRGYDTLSPIWEMVARTAYTQLHYSILWLAFCTLSLVLVFWVPLAGLASTNSTIFTLALYAWLGMTGSYLPTLRYYRQHPLWALTLPMIAGLYMAMTWTSAIRYWRGERSRWKNRSYATPAPHD
ncbi:glycosyltransferase [Candidatus Methylospira mobilis]|uniref:Glycosyltransferase n=1 Tax=Candidatus Methylospira mobilis TaxID=1808979 RepID=A0A5Q0BNM4_9GAMM|nr:glycosyltransferase [Candidatus Methylospira mobilis]QFY44772.1 glycosyltransferase [Candidatus Methylospira mobilis]WNV05687.1 glycosyltransferase [Candidatus Methylospira mobilis]